MEKDFNGILFRINGLSCSIDAMEIREIVAGAEWKPLSVEGEADSFLQVRGKAAKVLDLRKRFGFPAASLEGVNSFIAVQAPGGDRNRLVALWVDMVLELVNVPRENLKKPGAGLEMDARFIRQTFDYQGEPAYVLNLAEILKPEAGDAMELALKDKAS